jgi:aminopeptidase N
MLLLAATALALASPDLPGTVGPDRDWDAVHLDLALDLDVAGRQISGTATWTLAPLGPPPTELRLDQRALAVTAVTVDGEPVPFTLGDHTLVVDTGERTAPVQVAVTYSASPRHGLHFRAPGRDSPDDYLEVWSQGEQEENRYWFPLVDDPGDRFTVATRFTAPKGLRVLSNGVGGWDGEAWSYRLDEGLVSYLVMVAAAAYDVHTDDGGSVPLEAWVPPGTPDDVVATSWGATSAILDSLGVLTGVAYPYARYTTVYVQRFLWGGMENTTATVMNTRHLIAPVRQETRWSVDYIVAHEAAHQWFGDYLTCRTWSELWLNEGFATFFGDEVMGERLGPDHRAVTVARRYASGRKSGPLAGRWWSTADGDHSRYGRIYTKGAAVLQMLRVLYGEPVFDRAIARYVTDNAHGLVTTHDLRVAFEAETGDHLGWWFDQWVHLGPPPPVDVGWTWKDGTLTVTARQDGDTPFVLPLDVHVAGETHRLWLEEGTGRWTLPVAERPAYVAVDPDGGVLSELRIDQDAAAWRAQLTASPTPYARVQALAALGDADTTDETVAALTDLAGNTATVDAVRIAAVEALSHHTPGRATLVGLLGDPADRVREASAKALGRGGAHPDAADALNGVARGDDNVDVRIAALRALAHQAPDRALRLSRERLLLRNKPLDQAVAAEVVGKHGELKDLGELKRLVHPRTATHVRHAAATGAVRLIARVESPGERKRLSTALARDLEPMLDDADIRTRRHVLGLLAEVGDKKTIARLQAWKRTETVAHLTERATETITQIRERDDAAPAPPAAVAGRLEDLEIRLTELDERLAEVEEHH